MEQIRALRFETLPRPQEVSPAQAQREGLEDLDRSYPAARRHADEEVLKLLGLLEPSVDLRKVSASIFGEGVAGYYDPRTKRLRIVRGAQTANRVLNEITLAHELTHALEDQRFGLDLEDASGSDDAALANLALVEGSATAVMLTYAERHFSPEQTLGGLLSSLGQDTGDLPPFIEAQLIFPYISGPGLHPAPLRDGRRPLVARERRPTASARPPRPSRCCTPTSTCRSSSPSACAARRARCSAPAGGGSRPGRGASGRPASCWATPAPRRAGAATATSCGSAAAATAARRAATATRSSCAGAGTRARRRARVRDGAAGVAGGAPGAERGRLTRP